MRQVLIESGINYVEVANEAALERGIYAASMSTSKRAMKRHECRAPISPCPLVAVRKDFGLTYRAKDN